MAYTANFLAELANSNFKGNLVAKIGNDYFSQFQVDSGLVIDADKIGMLDDATVGGVSLDIRKAETPVAGIAMKIIDIDGIFSSYIGKHPALLQDERVDLYFGFITGSFDFADYALFQTTYVRSCNKSTNGWNITTRDTSDLLQKELLRINGVLNGSISAVATTLDLDDASGFPSSGKIKIDEEIISYSGKSTNTLTGLTRADESSTADTHESGADVYFVTIKEDKAMNIALDVIINDLGIDASLVDQTSFTDLRDGVFSGEANYKNYIYNVENGLTWLQDEILLSTNTRLVTINGLLTLILLDQVPTTEDDVFDESSIKGTPSFRISSDKIVNYIEVKWNYSLGLNKFTRTTVISDADSIAIFGQRKTYTLELKGVYDSLIATDRGSRIISRMSTPKAEIGADTLFEKFYVNIGENVRLIHRYLPQQGGGLGFNDTLEVMSKAPKALGSDAAISWKFEYSSYTGVRIGLIAPSPLLNLGITDQKTFEVPDASCYKVGFQLKLWDNTNGVYFSDPVNIIEEINGNYITMRDAWATTLGPTVRLKLADYDQSEGNAKAEYAFISPNTGEFVSDGSKAYQIIP